MAIYYIAYELHDGDLDDYCSIDEKLEDLGAQKIMQFMWVIQIPGSQVSLFNIIRKYLSDQQHDKLVIIKPRDICLSQALHFLPGQRPPQASHVAEA
ncbi:hypothetical protein KCM76_20755 [Zooshikella marina]|uniref:hypothetical protein n=1 Tax=Zooshikella ganghwensis TaxID=202772 RepID=UPI001BAEC800|nr:hypothetical protein [Zooshikella ganghwensis]MBU2708436.1 hypothetical protein [Zooshikella ganghwensis]